jgi:hypothetical protein
MQRATTREAVPSGALTVRLTARERARLEQLMARLDTTQSRAVNIAMIHLLATLELGERIHGQVPSEQKAEP